MAGRVFDTKRHTNVKRRAEYRRVNKYYKSLEKTKAEKARRRQIVDLQRHGLTLKQIAQQLHVSQRTVKRDLARMEPYFKKKRTQMNQQEVTDFLKQLDGLSRKRQLETIHKYMTNYRRILEPHSRKTLQITINLDAIFRGYYGVKFKPDLPIKMLENGRITLILETGGRKQAVARIYVGKINYDAAVLQTNQSMNQFVEPVLKGWRVVAPNQESIEAKQGGS